MNFANPQMLWLLLVIPPALVAFLWWSARERERLMTQFIQPRLLPGLIAGVSTTRQKIRAMGLVAAVVCLVVALARPQWGFDWQEVSQRGLDIVVAIDTSKSMLAEDIAPNRLARAKLAALDLMQQAKSDRLGLVAFAGSAFLQCPLTIDDSAFRQSLDALDVNIIPEGGTAIGEAITTAAKAFKEGENHKVLVLFTDGEDHDSNAVDAAKKAKEAGLVIFTVGIGSAEGELLRIKNAEGKNDYVRDESGNVVKSHLNEALLQQIAGATEGGFYLPLRGANTMDTLYQRGIAPLPKSDAQEKLVKRPLERYHWPLGLAIALLMAEIIFPERRSPTRRESKAKLQHAGSETGVPLALVVGLVLIGWPGLAFASPAKALREYKAGRYEESQQEYERALQAKTNDLRLQFNAGAAAYKDKNLAEAAKHFDQALVSPDLNLQQQAYYNLGNTLYQLGEQNSDPAKKKESWEGAVKSYESAIKLTTNNADAKFNEEFVEKMLEELKKQEQQQQKKDSDKDQKQDKDQPQDQKQDRKDQSKDDQKKDSQQQQKQQDQKKDSSQQQQQAKNQKPEDQKKQPPKPDPSQEKKDEKKAEQQQAKKSDDQQKPEDQEQGRAVAAGEMTRQEAKQLLDNQKNDEMLMPVSRKEKAADQQRVMKDW